MKIPKFFRFLRTQNEYPKVNQSKLFFGNEAFKNKGITCVFAFKPSGECKRVDQDIPQ